MGNVGSVEAEMGALARFNRKTLDAFEFYHLSSYI